MENFFGSQNKRIFLILLSLVNSCDFREIIKN